MDSEMEAVRAEIAALEREMFQAPAPKQMQKPRARSNNRKRKRQQISSSSEDDSSSSSEEEESSSASSSAEDSDSSSAEYSNELDAEAAQVRREIAALEAEMTGGQKPKKKKKKKKKKKTKKKGSKKKNKKARRKPMTEEERLHAQIAKLQAELRDVKSSKPSKSKKKKKTQASVPKKHKPRGVNTDGCFFCSEETETPKNKFFQCDDCEKWMHTRCANLTIVDITIIHTYKCSVCVREEALDDGKEVGKKPRAQVVYKSTALMQQDVALYDSTTLSAEIKEHSRVIQRVTKDANDYKKYLKQKVRDVHDTKLANLLLTALEEFDVTLTDLVREIDWLTETHTATERCRFVKMWIDNEDPDIDSVPPTSLIQLQIAIRYWLLHAFDNT